MSGGNAYTGEVSLALGGRACVLVYDWRALAALRTAFEGRDPFEVLDGGDPEAMAEMVAIGLRRHQPEIDAAAVLDASPPILETVNAVAQALRWAYWGAKAAPEEAPEGGSENPPRAAAGRRSKTR